MGSVIISYNNHELHDQLCEKHGRHSTQASLGRYSKDRVLMSKFARLNGSGARIVADRDGNAMALIGYVGFFESGAIVADLERILTEYMSSESKEVFCNRLWGNFVICVYEAASQRLAVIKDFANTFNFYWAKGESGYHLSNNSLTLASCIQSTPCNYGIANFLSFISLLEHNSLFKNIHKFPPATITYFSPDDEPKVKYYSMLPADVESEQLQAYKIAEISRDVLKVSRFWHSTSNIDLTGGYDTRLMAAAALSLDIEPVFSVHGEEDEEVRFVRDVMAAPLNLDCHVLCINSEIDDAFVSDINLLHYLFEGSYSLYDAYKEGMRSIVRSRFSDSKITGGIGEYLRDKWYTDLYKHGNPSEAIAYLKSRFEYYFFKNDRAHLIKDILTDGFNSFLDKDYRATIREMINNDFQRLNTTDYGYLYLNTAFRHYISSWLGHLYGGHNQIVLVVAPYNEKHLVEYGLPKPNDNKKSCKAQVEAINQLFPPFERINFIDGYPCQVKDKSNAWQFRKAIYKNFASKAMMHLFVKLKLKIHWDQKTHYDYGHWINLLYRDKEWKETIEHTPEILPDIIDEDKWPVVLNNAKNGKLTSTHQMFVGRLITLAKTYSMSNIK